MFVGIIIFLLPVIFILSFEISDLNDRLKNKQDEVDYLLDKFEEYEEEIRNYEYVIKNSVVNDISKNKVVNYMYGEATAYTPSERGINSDSDPTKTSIMKPAKNGVIAVNPKVIPYGSEVMIISGKTIIRGKAWDTGGDMMKNPKQVDILMENLEDSIEWGRREVHIIWWEE